MPASDNSLSKDTNFTARSTATSEARATDPTIQRVCGLLTEPIGADVLQLNGSPINLETSSHHQGWVDQPEKGSWSWFEVAIIASYAPVTTPGDVNYDCIKKGDKLLAWVALRHPVNQNGQFETFDYRFPEHHEIWKYLQAGDRLAVFACAQFRNWSCTARSIELKVMDNTAPCPKPPVKTATGTVTQTSGNRILFVFDVDGFTKKLDTTLTPSLPPFSSKLATITYWSDEAFFGTYSFTGYVGKSDYSITLVDDDNAPVSAIAGDLDNSLRQKSQVRGTGTWMST